jgi:hypothetical protein
VRPAIPAVLVWFVPLAVPGGAGRQRWQRRERSVVVSLVAVRLLGHPATAWLGGSGPGRPRVARPAAPAPLPAGRWAGVVPARAPVATRLAATSAVADGRVAAAVVTAAREFAAVLAATSGATDARASDIVISDVVTAARVPAGVLTVGPGRPAVPRAGPLEPGRIWPFALAGRRLRRAAATPAKPGWQGKTLPFLVLGVCIAVRAGAGTSGRGGRGAPAPGPAAARIVTRPRGRALPPGTAWTEATAAWRGVLTPARQFRIVARAGRVVALARGVMVRVGPVVLARPPRIRGGTGSGE